MRLLLSVGFLATAASLLFFFLIAENDSVSVETNQLGWPSFDLHLQSRINVPRIRRAHQWAKPGYRQASRDVPYKSFKSLRVALSNARTKTMLQWRSNAIRKAVPQNPGPNSLFYRLWDDNIATVNETVSSEFIVGIRNGTLNPDAYAAWSISDAYYCYHAAESYAIAVTRAENELDQPQLVAILRAKKAEFDAYNQVTFVQRMRLRDARDIVPSEVIARYTRLERFVAEHMHPVYSLVVQLPCEVLWAWLGVQLEPAIRPRNLYDDWIISNIYPAAGFACGNFLEWYRSTYPHVLNESIASRLYSTAMQLELDNFNSV